MTARQIIYHLLPQSEHLAQAKKAEYSPASLTEEGFIHCSADEATLLTVANAFYQTLNEPLLCYVIDTTQLTAPLRYEAPITPSHAKNAPKELEDTRFPHLYGPLNRTAIRNILRLQFEDGQWLPPAD